ncbi:MAG: FadR family transcriptional regulator [Actinomycetota bacterium]|nr:FadR family transcriptional regulator [Actinomycetota bacterium]
MTQVPMSQTDVVVHGIKQMILDGELSPGDQLPIEKDLGPRLGVSRSSLREGVRALSMMGVLESRQGAGTFVTQLDPSMLLAPMGFVVDFQGVQGSEQVHAVRRVLETEAAGLAALRIDDEALDLAESVLERSSAALDADPVDHDAILALDVEFHRIVARASGNAVLESLVVALGPRTVRTRLWRAIVEEGVEQKTIDEHRAILKALRDRSPQHAEVRMANHLLAVEEFLRERPVPDDVDLPDVVHRPEAV